MPNPATENRVVDAVLARLATIGTPPSSYLTSPAPAREGVPADVTDPLTKPLILVEHARTDPDQQNVNVSDHGARVTLSVWLMAKDPRTVASMKADVLRALFAGEGTFTTALGQPLFPGEFVQRGDMRSVGRAVGQLVIFVDITLTHANP